MRSGVAPGRMRSSAFGRGPLSLPGFWQKSETMSHPVICRCFLMCKCRDLHSSKTLSTEAADVCPASWCRALRQGSRQVVAAQPLF